MSDTSECGRCSRRRSSECEYCDGRGQMSQLHPDSLDYIDDGPCPKCLGAGYLCPVCWSLMEIDDGIDWPEGGAA